MGRPFMTTFSAHDPLVEAVPKKVQGDVRCVGCRFVLLEPQRFDVLVFPDQCIVKFTNDVNISLTVYRCDCPILVPKPEGAHFYKSEFSRKAFFFLNAHQTNN